MAVMASGRAQLEGAPAELLKRTRGRIWTEAPDRTELQRNKKIYQLIATRLPAGRTLVHVASDTDPGDGFAVRGGNLDDVYLSTVALSRPAA
jgi:hypothetical protein